jgi:hypothetical protein
MRYFILTLIAALFWAAQSPAQSRRERREAQIAESEKPKNISGGTVFQVAIEYGKAYDAVLNHLKRQGYTIDSASKETGQIITAMSVTGKGRQTGKRIQVVIIKDNDAQSSIRVAAVEQRRAKVLQAEPWSEPKLNEEDSTKVADELKAVLKS